MSNDPTFRYDPEEGLLFSHDCNYPDLIIDRTGGTFRHVTRLPINVDRGWTVQQADPLTVTPSILCGSCGCHGFITNGEWVPV